MFKCTKLGQIENYILVGVKKVALASTRNNLLT